MGNVEEALGHGDFLKGLPVSDMACGHVRYGTNETKTKEARLAAIQPMLGGNSHSKFALSHNGHLVNFEELRQEHPRPEQCHTDSQLMTHLIGEEVELGAGLYDAMTSVSRRLNGAYSLVVMGGGRLYGMRDPNGFRPLMLGSLNVRGWAIASEVAALDIVGATFEREVEAGEVVEVSDDGLRSFRPFEASEISSNLCAFEIIYLSRPDNVVAGELVARARRQAGIELARLFPVDADLVTDAPDSGTLAADGYAHKSGLPKLPALVKNKYVGRSFIAAGQANREEMVAAKFNAVPEIVEGQSVVVVDDSIIRGTTTKGLVNMLRKAGARQVHLRIASSPYQWPCFYGMDTANRGQLIAAEMSVAGICEELGADSLEYIPLKDLEATFGKAAGKVCMACMTGEYPTDVPRELLYSS